VSSPPGRSTFVQGDDAAELSGRIPHKEGKGFRLHPFET
jgi:hypothetical protein